MAIKAGKLANMVKKSTSKWTKQKKAEIRNSQARMRRWDAMRIKPERRTIKDAAFAYMETAYDKVSSFGSLPAVQRQIMYAARGYILENSETQSLNGETFRRYLKEYIRDNVLEDDWDVVFDDRGTFYEPHTDKKVPIGTLDVREYLGEVGKHEAKIAKNVKAGDPPLRRLGELPKFTDALYPTVGPAHRYGAILVIEKEGFMPLFNQSKLAEAYDIAIMANKGQAVDAARKLIDELGAVNTGVPIFIVRDFDIAGFSIAAKVSGRNTDFYTFRNEIQFTDLGLRLDDCEDLESEPVVISTTCPSKVVRTLRKNGATPAEVDFLFPFDKWAGGQVVGKRVELNAFTSEAFIDWLEGKFMEYGVKKVIPDANVLDEAYRRAYELERYRKLLEEHKEEITADAEDLELPDDLVEVIREEFDNDPEMSWDAVINSLAKKEVGG